MTLKIHEAIERPYAGPQTYRNLIGMLGKSSAEADITFWGVRCITVKGYQGWYPIDGLVNRVDHLVTENYNFNLEERAIGNQLTHRICELEEESEKKLPGKWFWTRFFVFCREFHISSPRCVIDYTAGHQYSSYYTESQYEEAFGKKPATEPFIKKRAGGEPSIWKAPKR